MEKKPNPIEFDSCITQVEFNTVSDSIICSKKHYKGDEMVSLDRLSINLKTIPFQTAMTMACEYVRSVILVNYE